MTATELAEKIVDGMLALFEISPDEELRAYAVRSASQAIAAAAPTIKSPE